jgi:uncharacterized protein DUF6949
MMWRGAANFAKQGRSCGAAEELCDVARCLEFPVVALHRLRTGGRADQRISGAGATPGGVRIARAGRGTKALAAVPFLVFAAPFIIMRNTLRGTRIERRRFEFVMLATILAGFWSLMSGTFFLMTLRAAGLLA